MESKDRNAETYRLKYTMAHHSSPRKIPAGAAKLCEDMATLVNNRQGSDIQFKVGGGNTSALQENGETIYDESSTVTLYAHSVILRCRSKYFAAMLDEDKNWRESSKGVIYKPNISSSTFQDILHYIYTGDVRAKSSENIIELITAANEMDLEELSTECLTQLIHTVKYIFSDENDSGEENESGETFEGSTNLRIPIDMALRTHIIPALNLSSSNPTSHFSQKLLAVILPHMSVITKSPDTYTTFIDGISSETLAKIIASDDLTMNERNVWDLVLSWGCHRAKLLKSAVEACLSKPEDDEKDGEEPPDGTAISDHQLSQLKKILTPFLPAIRFSLLYHDDYNDIFSILIYFLPRHRLSELNRFFMDQNHVKQLDTRRNDIIEPKTFSKIVVKSTAWKFLRENIFKTGGITGCSSSNHLKFELLFRASEHGFLAKTFHQRCDNKGPTLVLVRSADGHLFGGINFNDWTSPTNILYSSSYLNFLFALPDGKHRKDSTIFRIKFQDQAKCSSCNYYLWGPTFGSGSDLHIANSANTNQSSVSVLPSSYEGEGASDTALAGGLNFVVSDYEVFTISKG